jgi:hypothetical protein
MTAIAARRIATLLVDPAATISGRRCGAILERPAASGIDRARKPCGTSAMKESMLPGAACWPSPAPPTARPTGIVLRWYPNDTSFAAADAAARAHCGAYGRVAELTAEQQDGSAETARFRCPWFSRCRTASLRAQ